MYILYSPFQVIQATQPDIVSVELCMDRIKILQLDEDTVLREAKDMNFQKVKANIAQVYSVNVHVMSI